jgi:hypothetical protein
LASEEQAMGINHLQQICLKFLSIFLLDMGMCEENFRFHQKWLVCRTFAIAIH